VNARLAAIEIKRAGLLERAARQRGDLASALQAFSRPLDIIDRVVGAVRYVVSQPTLLAGALLVFALMRPRSAFRWGRRAWGIWRGYRWLTRKVAV